MRSKGTLLLQLLVLSMIPTLYVHAAPTIDTISYHGKFIAVQLENNGLTWVNLYTDDMRRIWSSSKARFVEFNWSSTGSLAVRLCKGPCYNVNWQRVQVYDPLSGRSWNSSEARFVKFWWSQRGKLAVVLWLSPCPDYSKHWMELYDPSTGKSYRSEMRGFVYAKWSPKGELAAVVADENGYHLEILDDKLSVTWRTPDATGLDFKWSEEGRLAVRLEHNGTKTLLLRDGNEVMKLAEGTNVHYAWSNEGDLVYSVDGEVKVLKFQRAALIWFVPPIAALLLILVFVVRRSMGESKQERKDYSKRENI